MYIWELENWPNFSWDHDAISSRLGQIKFAQGKLLGQMEFLGFNLQSESALDNLTNDVLKSSEIEGEIYDPFQVRSSVAKKLGINFAGATKIDRNIEGAVNMLVDATTNYAKELTEAKLKAWQASLFPIKSNIVDILVGDWRDDRHGPMQVVSGPISKEKVHFQAPPASAIQNEMERFINWFNTNNKSDNIIKAAVAHLWFVTIHPFEDGNGRITRAITDKLMARADGTDKRFYSISMQICNNRNQYYAKLEQAQKGALDVTNWLLWFMECVANAIQESESKLSSIKAKALFWDRLSQQSLNERQVKILNMLQDNFEGNLTSSKWAKLAKCSQDTAHRDILDLINKRILEKNQSGGRSTSYKICE